RRRRHHGRKSLFQPWRSQLHRALPHGSNHRPGQISNHHGTRNHSKSLSGFFETRNGLHGHSFRRRNGFQQKRRSVLHRSGRRNLGVQRKSFRRIAPHPT